jgi:hypothetical protein
MNIPLKVLCLPVALVALTVSGCASVQYGDARAVETINTDFGSTDLQLISAKMVDDLLNSAAVLNITRDGRPVLFVDAIRNKTAEHIDTESVTDTISTQLIKSGRFRFVDMSVVAEVARQFDYQRNSGLVDERQSVKMGQQVGARFMIYGNLSGIAKQDGSSRDQYYKFTLKMMDLKTGLVEFQDEKEIRKTRERRWFGL